MKDVTIEDVKHFIRAKSEYPMIHVRDMDDPIYKEMEKLVLSIWPETEKHPYAIATQIKEIFFTMRYMEPNDYEKVRFTLSKYQVKGTHGGVKGTSSYGYDRSRVDGAMIKRKRGN
tara:strand:+ start:237 stop:584 length:348 start_codon:yes stop_codon:yes gene_type:complete